MPPPVPTRGTWGYQACCVLDVGKAKPVPYQTGIYTGWRAEWRPLNGANEPPVLDLRLATERAGVTPGYGRGRRAGWGRSANPYLSLATDTRGVALGGVRLYHPQKGSSRRGTLTVLIVDDGKAFELSQAPEPNLQTSLEDRPLGGLSLCSWCAKSWTATS